MKVVKIFHPIQFSFRNIHILFKLIYETVVCMKQVRFLRMQGNLSFFIRNLCMELLGTLCPYNKIIGVNFLLRQHSLLTVSLTITFVWFGIQQAQC